MSRAPRERFFDLHLECVVLITSTDLPGHPDFKSFTLYGEIDRPVRLDLYASQRPAHDEHPVAIFDRDEAVGMVLRPPVKIERKVRAPVQALIPKADTGPMVYAEGS